jgi:hypothetical protein
MQENSNSKIGLGAQQARKLKPGGMAFGLKGNPSSELPEGDTTLPTP